jgi:3-oxoacyl-[acyl-carrier protein] reductase
VATDWLAGKSVIVTGAGSGIGYALCHAFASGGATVGLNDIDTGLGRSAAERINTSIGSMPGVRSFAGDVANVDDIHTMFARFLEAVGRLDIVIANAGITQFGDFLTETPEAFDRVTGVNLRGTFFTAQTAARIMVEARVPGRIILMSSVAGARAHPRMSAYGVTKAGIRMMARSIALELGGYGITANAISPGATLTERTLHDDPNYEENWAGVVPTGRVGQVEDIVAAAMYLASPQAAHVTGQTLVVDGGWTVRSTLPSAYSSNEDAFSDN